MDRMDVYSEQKSWSATGSQPFTMTFLEQVKGMVSPALHALYLIVDAVITVPSGDTLPGRDLPTMFSRIDFVDAGGPRASVRGSSLRIINILEKGSAYSDHADLAAGASQAVTFILEVPFAPQKSRRRRDFTVPVDELMAGGKLAVYFNGATLNGVGTTTATIVSATIQFWAEVVEERKRELKSRMTWLEYDIGQKNYQYPAQGSLRWLLMYNGEVGVFNGRNWGTQNITSLNLRITQERSDLLQFKELAEHPYLASVDPVALNQIIPVYYPKKDQKIPDMPDIDTAHLQFDGTLPASTDLPKVLVCSIVDRPSGLSARTMKAVSPNQLVAAIDQLGYIKAANGEKTPVANVPAVAVRRMPVKLANPKSVPGQFILRELASKRKS